MTRALVDALQRAAYTAAVTFYVVAIVLSFVPLALAIGCMWCADDLSGEWRRGRRQTRLWSWAKRMRRD